MSYPHSQIYQRAVTPAVDSTAGGIIKGAQHGRTATNRVSGLGIGAFGHRHDLKIDLIPVSDEIPYDGIIFARLRSYPDTLVVLRTLEERMKNPERLNLDRRNLDACPILEQEHRIRLLNFQNNNIQIISNLENLPSLIFLDMYNNKLGSLDGSLSTVTSLRVLMAGKNKISSIGHSLSNLRKLDVLDLHSNEIITIEGLECLQELRVLNLAGNKIGPLASNLCTLRSLTELNLRRNKIEKVIDLDRIQSLQRIFLSHNRIADFKAIDCIFDLKLLCELSLDGNPIADATDYKDTIIVNVPSLRLLDLRRVLHEERAAVGPQHWHRGSTGGNEGGGDRRSDERLSPTEETDSSVLKPYGDIKSEKQSMGTFPISFPEEKLLARNSELAKPDALPAIEERSTCWNVDSKGAVSSMERGSSISVEVVGPNEKALIAQGDDWDANSIVKGDLAAITHLYVVNCRSHIIIDKLSPLLNSLDSVNSIQMQYNPDSKPSLYAWRCIFESLSYFFRDQVLTFSLTDAVNERLMRSVTLAYFPNLSIFCDVPVVSGETEAALSMLRPLLLPAAPSSSSSAAGKGLQSAGSFVNDISAKQAIVASSRAASAQKAPTESRTRLLLDGSRFQNAFDSVSYQIVKDIMTEISEADSYR